MLPRTRETPTQGETSRDRISVARQQNESEQQVGLVSFTTDVNSLQARLLGRVLSPLSFLILGNSKTHSRVSQASKILIKFRCPNLGSYFLKQTTVQEWFIVNINTYWILPTSSNFIRKHNGIKKINKTSCHHDDVSFCRLSAQFCY